MSGNSVHVYWWIVFASLTLLNPEGLRGFRSNSLDCDQVVGGVAMKIWVHKHNPTVSGQLRPSLRTKYVVPSTSCKYHFGWLKYLDAPSTSFNYHLVFY